MEERKFQVIETCVRSAFLEWLIQSDTSSALEEILSSVKNDPDYPSVASPIQSPRAEPLPLMTSSPMTLDRINSTAPSADLLQPEQLAIESTIDLSGRSSKSVCKMIETPTDIPSSGTSIEALQGANDKFESSSITEADAVEVQSFFEPPSFYENANRGLDEESQQVLRNAMMRGGAGLADNQQLTISISNFEEFIVQKLWGLNQYMTLVLWCLITKTPFESFQKVLAETGSNKGVRDLTYNEITSFWIERHLSLVDPLDRGADWNFYVCLLNESTLDKLPQHLGTWPQLAKLPPITDLQNLSACIREVVSRHPTVEFLRTYNDFQNNLCETVLLKCLHDLLNGVKNGLRSDWRGSSGVQAEYEDNLQGGNEVLFEFEDIAYSVLNKKWHQVRYEEFYVMYCMFSNLDTNRKFGLDRQDLIKYNHWAMSNFLITRIFQEGSYPIISNPSPGGGASTRSPVTNTSAAATGGDVIAGLQMKYTGFFWFAMLDEDKTTDQSIEFWFRILDLDGDGYIQKYEIERFYLDQQARLISRSMDAPPLDVVYCQIADMIRAETPFKITVRDIKKQRRNAPLFFNTLLSLTKFLLWEHRDPFSSKAEILEYPLFTEWDRWCRLEYERLATDDKYRDETSETLEVSGGAAY